MKFPIWRIRFFDVCLQIIQERLRLFEWFDCVVYEIISFGKKNVGQTSTRVQLKPRLKPKYIWRRRNILRVFTKLTVFKSFKVKRISEILNNKLTINNREKVSCKPRSSKNVETKRTITHYEQDIPRSLTFWYTQYILIHINQKSIEFLSEANSKI